MLPFLTGPSSRSSCLVLQGRGHVRCMVRGGAGHIRGPGAGRGGSDVWSEEGGRQVRSIHVITNCCQIYINYSNTNQSLTLKQPT